MNEEKKGLNKDGLFLYAVTVFGVVFFLIITHLYPPTIEDKVNVAIGVDSKRHDTIEDFTIARQETVMERTHRQEIGKRIAELQAKIEEEREIFYIPAAVYNYTSDPTTQSYIVFAWEQFGWYGWGEYDLECLISLWHRESKWSPYAHNSSSGAHGIPQSLPAEKMASFGADYWDNGYTQILWGLNYISGRYGSPSNALYHSNQVGWY